MRRTIYVFPLLLLGAFTAAAQSINQSVQVTNEYETKFADFRKLGVESKMPDSLYRFDYSFDYSVFDSPYRGSYEFTPYEIKVTPDPMGYDGRKFYMRAGAGYTFRPVLDLVWSPVTEDNFTFGVYNYGSGYYGRYAERQLSGVNVGDAFTGYDFSNRFGMGGHYIMRGSDLRFAVGYDGMFANNTVQGSTYNSAFARVLLSSAPKSRFYFAYALGLDYRFGLESVSPLPVLNSTANDLRVYGKVGPVVSGKFAFLLDFDFDAMWLSRPEGYSSYNIGHAALTPHLEFSLGTFDFDVGVLLDYANPSDDFLFMLAPHVDISVDLFSGSTKLYAGLSGGRSLLTLYGLKSFNRFYNATMDVPYTTRERLNTFVGLEGRISRYFNYNLKGGYKSVQNMLLENLGGLAFADANMYYAGLELGWTSERVLIDGNLDFNHLVSPGTADAFAPAAFSGELKFSYNWMKRVYCGFDVEGSSRRSMLDGSDDYISGYVDAGVFAEYRFSRGFGIWFELGNILGMRIEKHPGYVLPDSYMTLGVSLRI